MERFVGRYGLLRRLGQGGMGAVHLALDLSTGEECALKRLDPRAVQVSPDSLQREFEMLTRLRHPAVVAVRELGMAPDGTPFLTMEYVPGLPADRAVSPGDWRTLTFIAAGVSEGLEALHAAGIIHGDLKPSNVLVVPASEPGAPPCAVRLLDFGLATLLGRDSGGHRGSPGYAAPEVVRGETPDVASDLYGLGATLYALATGRTAFTQRTPVSLLRRQLEGPPAAMPLEEAGMPRPLVELILHLMASSPAERPGDVREVRRELEHIHAPVRRSLAQRLHTQTVVGRERELARLERWLALAPDGPRIVLLSGAAGIGKTALLGDIAVRGALGGRPVFRLSGAGFTQPGALATALLQQVASEAQAESDGTELSARALAMLRQAPSGEKDLSLLADAAGAWSRAVERRRGLPLVLLDDWERVDSSSRALVRRIALRSEAVMRWVWAGRGEEGGLADEDQLLVQAGHAEELRLGPLDREGTERLLAARLHVPAPPGLGEFLWGHSGGHPGLLVVSLLAVAEAGALNEGDAGVTFDEAALAGRVLPAGFEESLLDRFAALSPEARGAAIALAVWRRPVTRPEIRMVETGASPSALEEVRIAGLATLLDTDRWALCPPGIGGRILDTLAVSERHRLHRAVLAQPGLSDAERFVHLREAGAAREALEVAGAILSVHADVKLAVEAAALAGEHVPTEAAVCEERAARTLIAHGRYQAAIPLLVRAIERGGSEEPQPVRRELLATSYLRTGNLPEAEETIARALSEDPPPHLRALLLLDESTRLVSLGRIEEARTTAQRARDLGETSEDAEIVGRAALALGGVALVMGRMADTENLGRQAEEACRRAGDQLGQVRALNFVAGTVAARKDLTGAKRLYDEALATARAADLRFATEEILSNLGFALIEAGEWSRARDAHAEAARIALEDGRRRGAVLAIGNLAQLDGLTGHATRALRQARTALRMSRLHAPYLASFAWRSLAQALRVTGRVSHAMRASVRAIAAATRMGNSIELDWCRIENGRACAAAGRWAEAEAVWMQSLKETRPSGSLALALLAALCGRAALRRRDFECAASRLASCEAWLEGRIAPYVTAHALQLRAESAFVQGRTNEGVHFARQALAAYGDLPAPADRAMAALDLARLALAGGQNPGAPIEEWLKEAAEVLGRLGDHPSRERALALTVECLDRSRAAASSHAQGRDLIRSVSRLLDSLSDLRELTQRAMAMAVEQFDAEQGVLLLADPRSGNLVPVVEHGAVDAATRDRAESYSRRAVERVAASGGSLLVGDAPSDPEALSESVVDLGLRSILCVPLFAQGGVVGAVYLDDTRRPDTFSHADRGLLEGFAHLLAVAIERSRGHEEVTRANELLVGENLALRREADVRFQPQNFVGGSAVMRRVLAVVERAAQISSTVLITGENGTGKELIARILHHSGKRRQGRFVVVNCGAIPETLLESELFGILPNVATGVRGREGRFVEAHRGTLFLDEVGDMPLQQQVALLSVIANHEITPVGGGRAIPVDVQIIAATNRDLRKRVEEGAFREDLFYRLNVIPIEVPPLRERKADIPALARHFAAHFAGQQERPVPELSPEFLAALMQSDWPGNVRELQNYIERIMAMTPGPGLHPQPPPRDLEGRVTRPRSERGKRLPELVADLERRFIRETLERCGGNQSRAARELGLTEQSLRYRLRKYAVAGARGPRRPRRKRR